MTSLSQTALEFAREVLGSKTASIEFGSEGVIWNGKLKEDFSGFHYTELSAVIDAVRCWCDRRDAAIELAYHGFLPGEWEARVVTPVSVEEMVHGDLCHALLAACLQSARKLKAA